MHRKGGVHDIAFTNGSGPRLHHIAFWVPTPMNIIDLLDVMSTTGYVDNIERGPGRHGIANAFFLYILTRWPPDRNLLFGLSDGRSGPRTHPLGSKGPAAPDQGCPTEIMPEQGTVFAGNAPRGADLKAQPIVAPRPPENRLMPQLVTFSRKDDPHGTPCFGRLMAMPLPI